MEVINKILPFGLKAQKLVPFLLIAKFFSFAEKSNFSSQIQLLAQVQSFDCKDLG